MALEPLAGKWQSFGWDVSGVDGHEFASLVGALRSTPESRRPKMVIARTVKGRGVRHLEHRKQAHFARLSPAAYERALGALRGAA